MFIKKLCMLFIIGISSSHIVPNIYKQIEQETKMAEDLQRINAELVARGIGFPEVNNDEMLEMMSTMSMDEYAQDDEDNYRLRIINNTDFRIFYSTNLDQGSNVTRGDFLAILTSPHCTITVTNLYIDLMFAEDITLFPDIENELLISLIRSGNDATRGYLVFDLRQDENRRFWTRDVIFTN